jgi:glutaredoxin
MWKLIAVIAIVAGVWYWQKGGSNGSVAFDKAGRPTVVMFTVNNCEPCQAAVNFMRERGVPFQEKKIDPDNGEDPDVKLWQKVGDHLFPVTLSGNGKVTNSSRWELTGLLGNNFGSQYLSREERPYFSRHVDAKGAPQIVLYGTDWCPSCAALRKDLRDHNVSFVDIDVEKSGESDRMVRVMEIPGYPAVWVGYTRVHGWNYDAVMAVMNKKI